MCNRSTSEKCGGKFERITRRCDVEGTKGVGLSCRLRLGWLVVIGAGEITQFPSGKPKVLCSRCGGKGVCRGRGGRERNWVRGVERRIVGGGGC